MKYIFEIEGEASAHISLDPYSFGSVLDPPKAWNGARCELLIVDLIDWNTPERKEGDSFRIEGSADAIREMLTSALSQLDLLEEVNKEHKLATFNRIMKCPRCGAYADPLWEEHGNGHGMRCYGLSKERLALVTVQADAADMLQAATEEEDHDPIVPE
jgi:hypothetical protein